MSEAKKPSFVERLFGGGTPSSPEPSPPKKEPPSKEPAKKEPPRDRPAEDEPPDRKRPPKRAETKAASQPKRSWFAELRKGLARSSSALSDNLASALTKRKLDEETLDELEEVLIKADLGVAMAGRIRDIIARGRYERGVSPDAVRAVLAAEVARVLEPLAQPFVPDQAARSHVVLVVGVNGTGKTTTIGKLAHHLKAQGLSVMLAAGDTFRAAAIDQLKVWGGRVGAEVVAKEVGADPAGVAYEALARARTEGTDVLLIDTAGRLQNKSDLMAELAKIVRVLKKLDPSAPHSVILVLDATTGQNAFSQVQ